MAAQALRDSDFADGCPIGTVACEVASTREAIRAASSAVFDSWRQRVTDRLCGEGVASERAAQLALLAVASLEGAILLSRNARDTAPLREVGNIVAAALRNEITHTP